MKDMKGIRGDLKTLDLAGVFRALGSRVRKDSSDHAKFHVECPWQHEHTTDGGPKESSIWQDGEGWPQFHCFHGHCAGRDIQDVLEWAESQQSGIIDEYCSRDYHATNGSNRSHTLAVKSKSVTKIVPCKYNGEREPLPTTLASVTPIEFMGRRYNEDDFISVVLAGNDGQPSKDNIWTLHAWRQLDRSQQSLIDVDEKHGVWYCINPLLDQSRRSNEDVADFRYCLLEGDGPKDGTDEEKLVAKEKQWAWFRMSGLPGAAAYDSGDKSIHALIKINARNRSEFKSRVQKIYEYAATLPGLDGNRVAESQLSRLPGAIRGDRKQSLLSWEFGAHSYEDWEAGLKYTTEATEADDDEELTQEGLERKYGNTDDVSFPTPMKEDAFIGPLGKLVDYILPHTEASREALLTQSLVALGNVINRTAYIYAGDDHYCSEFALLVGDTSVGRKGTSLRAIMSAFKHIDSDWVKGCEVKGVQSGEGIIHSVRDARYKRAEGKKEQERANEQGKICVDDGVEDKRKIIIAEEFAQVLAVAGRKESTVTMVLRDAWDCPRYLQNSAKNNGEVATEAHISMIAHTTREEFRKRTEGSTDISNGMFNRVLFVASKESKDLPDPKRIDWSRDADDVIEPLKRAIQQARKQGEHRIRRTPEAKARWDAFYRQTKHRIKNDHGLVAHALARLQPHVARLSVIYAVADCCDEVQLKHQRAAEAVAEYCEHSARWTFGVLTGDRMANKVIKYLRRRKNCSASRTKISNDVFRGHATSADLDRTLAIARSSGFVDFRIEKTATKTSEIWFLTNVMTNQQCKS